MKYQALFSLKNKRKINKVPYAAILLGSFRVKSSFLELNKYKCGTKMQLNSPDL